MSQELIPQAWLPEWPLAAAKLMLPQPYAGPIARPRLYDRLDAGMQRKLTLILAPAGFGKTMPLSDWVARRHRPAAWLSLIAPTMIRASSGRMCWSRFRVYARS